MHMGGRGGAYKGGVVCEGRGSCGCGQYGGVVKGVWFRGCGLGVWPHGNGGEGVWLKEMEATGGGVAGEGACPSKRGVAKGDF